MSAFGQTPSRSCAAAFVAWALLLLASSESYADKSPSEVEGTWYVLVHYKNALTAYPERVRWLDLVWTFERTRQGLEWTEYPIVVFPTREGRFERRSSGSLARTLGAWEPNGRQLLYLTGGPRVNKRGSASKRLRGSNERGWSSQRRRTARSVNVFTYEQRWSIQDLAGGGVFLREESLQSGLGEDASGRTRYSVEEVLEDERRGSYERDDTRQGTFRMIRVGSVRGLETDEDTRTVNERFYERQRDALLEAIAKKTQEGELPGELPWERKDRDEFPFLGASLRQALDEVSARPDGGANVIMQKIQIYQVDTDPWTEISEDEVRMGLVDKAGTYALLASRYCRSLNEDTISEWRSTDWFLFPNAGLAAYEYNDFEWHCVQQFYFFPARGPLATKERELLAWMNANFPHGGFHTGTFYKRGLSYLAADRVEDAKAMLQQGDTTFESAHLDLTRQRDAAGFAAAAGHEEYQIWRTALERAIRTREGPAATALEEE